MGAAGVKREQLRLITWNNSGKYINKIVWMRLLAFGARDQRNRGSFSKQERKPWERGYFCETCRSDLSSILKIHLILLLLQWSCRPVPLWLRKPFSPKSYCLDSIHAKAKI